MTQDVPRIVVTPPGPKSLELAKLQEQFIPKAVFNVTQIFVAESEGSLIRDVDGNVYIDFVSGISCLNMGHRNPGVIEAAEEQLNKYLHLCMHVTPYEPYVRLAERLAKMAPGNLQKKVVLINTGAEAVENAIKVARRYSGKPNIIVFENAFHGRTKLGMSLTGSVNPYKYGFGPLDPAIHRTPYAYCYRCAFGLEWPQCHFRCVEYIRETLAVHLSSDDVAAILVEPIQGEGGFIVPPKGFIEGLKSVCDENDFLLVDDEVQSGMGRTGKMFAIEHFGVTPDVIALAKSLGGGLPIGAVVARAEVLDSVQRGGLGGTFGGNPLSCVVALKAIDGALKSLDSATKLGSILKKRLDEMFRKFDIIGDVRGIGLMAGVELVRDRKTKEPANDEELRILKQCHKNGLIIMGAGPYKNVIRFLPPLNIGEDLLNKGLDIFEDAVRTLSAK